MSNRVLVLGLAAAFLAPACVGGEGDASFVVANRSDHVLEAVHLAEIDEPIWGANLLPDVLFPGEDMVVTSIDCRSYDVLVVDELGADCELHDNDLCFATDRWTIDNGTLGGCRF